MIRIYQQTIIVSPEVIDGNGHVNNTIYLHWMQDIVIAHSSANSWSPERYQEIKAGWFARSHYLEYLRPTFASDQLMIRTWVSGFAKTRSVRQYQIDCHQTVIFQAGPSGSILIPTGSVLPDRRAIWSIPLKW